MTTIQNDAFEKLSNGEDIFSEVRDAINQKKEIQLQQNYYTLTVVCFLKDVKAKYALSANLQNQNFFNCIVIMILQIVIVSCQYKNVFITEP